MQIFVNLVDKAEQSGLFCATVYISWRGVEVYLIFYYFNLLN